MAQAYEPLFSTLTRSVSTGAAYRDWATDFDDRARSQYTPVEASSESLRDLWRSAATAYLRAAKLRYDTRHYPEDLWIASECLARAGDHAAAAATLREYLKHEVVRRQPLAKVRLASSLVELGEWDEARRIAASVVDEYPHAAETYAARLAAARAAQAEGKLSEAVRSLQANFDDDRLHPDSVEWRQSLFLLGEIEVEQGRLLSRQADGMDKQLRSKLRSETRIQADHRLAAGAAALEEACLRYPHDARTPGARMLAAEAHRLLVQTPRERLETTTVQDTRLTLIGRMRRELLAAAEQLRLAAEGLERAIDAGDDAASVNLRNAYFTQGVVLFELEDYEEAIHAFETAASRFPERPEALSAFVQLAACYNRLGKPMEAAGVLEQAKAVLERLPDEVDFSRTVNFSRGQWLDHLNWLQQQWGP